MKFQANHNKHAEPETPSKDWGSTVRLALDLLSDKQRINLNKQLDPSNKIKPFNPSEPDSVEFDLNKLNCSKDILRALHVLAHQENINLSTQLELLVRFDDLNGWVETGAKSCAAWMSMHLQIDRRTAWERLRVGRQLRELPLINRLFQLGRLSWSKVRLLTRIATPENEQLLAHASTDATVNDVQRICEEYRWPATNDDDSEAHQSRLQWERRSFNWQTLPDGSMQIKLVLPPERAQNFLHAIDHCEDLIYHEDVESSQSGSTNVANVANTANVANRANAANAANEPLTIDQDATSELAEYNATPSPSPTPSQRRADAAVLIAERSIAFRGEHLSSADRYQVVLNIDSNSLSTSDSLGDINSSGIPPRKPTIEGVGAVPVTTARKIACDCSIIKLLSESGEPLNIGRKQRIWSPSLRRAILTRDRHCQFPGCTSHKFLQIHHMVHWADGGETSIDNGVCLCQFHHQLVHSEAYTVERATIETNQWETAGLFSSSMKKLLPTRCRFVFKRGISANSAINNPISVTEQQSPRGDCSHDQPCLHNSARHRRHSGRVLCTNTSV